MAGEGELQSKILEYLRPYRDVWYMNKWGNAVEHGGTPDMILCIRGRFIAFELKNPNKSNDVDKRQRVEMKKIRNAYGLSYKIDSFDDFLTVFTELNKKKPLI